MPTSQELLNRYAAHRDGRAFAAVAREHAGMVFSTCYRILGNAAEAEDAAQESFWELARKASEVPEAVSAWLHRVATHKALHAARARTRRKRHEARSASVREQARSKPTWAEVSPIIDEAINDLPDADRNVIVLHYLEGKTQSEVATLVGASQPTISRHIEKAVDLLRDILKKRGFLVTATALGGFFTVQTASAAVPLGVTAAIGKIAASGAGTVAAGTAVGTTAVKTFVIGTAMKKAIAIAVIAATVAAGGVVAQKIIEKNPADQQEEFAIASPKNPPVDIATRFTDALREQNLPFLDENKLAELQADLESFVASCDTTDIGNREYVALLNAIDRYVAEYFRKSSISIDMDILYLEFPDRIGTFKWKLWHAIQREDLIPTDRKRLDEQLAWMRSYIEQLPEERREGRVYTPQKTLAEFEAFTKDPLCPLFHQPMSQDQFKSFKKAFSEDRHIRMLSRAMTKILLRAWEALYPYPTAQSIVLPFDDKVKGSGQSNERIHLRFESNALFLGRMFMLGDIEDSWQVLDTSKPEMVETPDSVIGNGGAFRRWLTENGKGDVGYDDAKGGGLFAVRGAKIAKLAITNWIAADKLTNDELREHLMRQGQRVVMLEGLPEATNNPRIFVGVLTAEGNLSVLEVYRSDTKAEIGLRVRQRTSAFTAILSNGTIIELVGVSTHPSNANSWWKPDGVLLPTMPDVYIGGSGRFEEENATIRDFACRLHNFVTGTSIKWRLAPYSASRSSLIPVHQPDKTTCVRLTTVIRSNQVDSTNLSIGVISQDWEIIATSSGAGESISGKDGGILFSAAASEDGGIAISTTDEMSADLARRIVAVDHDDKVHAAKSRRGERGDNIQKTDVWFPIRDIDTIKEYRFEVCPYQWVTFENVSLQPGHKTDVEVSVQEEEIIEPLQPIPLIQLAK